VAQRLQFSAVVFSYGHVSKHLLGDVPRLRRREHAVPSNFIKTLLAVARPKIN
jgi:hypothetical protein